MMARLSFPRSNNLEWLRLIFAMQVVLMHAANHIGAGAPRALEAIPGVPAFFFVSGFLIYASYRNAPDIRYFENRFLRLFPGLLAVTVGSLVVILVAKGLADLVANPGLYVGWMLSQLTLGQALNPAHFRDVGVGVINGSLWTITVELLFYIAVPFVVWCERNVTKHTVLLLTGASYALYAIGPSVLTSKIAGKELYEYIAITPVAWGWMFGFGILAVKNWDMIRSRLGYLPLASIPMIAMIGYGDGVIFNWSGNRIGLLYFSCYCCLILYFAFGIRSIPLRHDISYGTYIWHMPIINLLIVIGMPYPVLAIPLTICAATLSWFCVERPALSLKRKSLKGLDGPTAAKQQLAESAVIRG